MFSRQEVGAVCSKVLEGGFKISSFPKHVREDNIERLGGTDGMEFVIEKFEDELVLAALIRFVYRRIISYPACRG